MLQNQQAIKYQKGFLLFDVSPFVYIGYNAALNALQADTLPAFIPVAEKFIRAKIEQCFCYAEQYCNTILPVFVYDGFPQWKQNIQKGTYKEGRDKVRFNPAIKNTLKKYVKTLGGLHLYNPNEEADDIICTAKAKLIEKFGLRQENNSMFYIFTTDNDLMQLSGTNTVCYNPINGGSVKDKNYLFDKFKIDNFKKIVLHKICFGDSSDAIDGIFKGKRRAPILEIIASVKNFEEFYNNDLVKPFEQKARELEKIIKLKPNCDIPDKQIIEYDEKIWSFPHNFVG